VVRPLLYYVFFVCLFVILGGWDVKGKATSVTQQPGTAHKAPSSHARISQMSTSETLDALSMLKQCPKARRSSISHLTSTQLNSTQLPIDRKLHSPRAAPFLCFLHHVYACQHMLIVKTRLQ